MSSGKLPFEKYHRAQSLGEGTYGSVVCVYNDAGEELALKMFDVDENNGTLELGTLRELSILRLIRGANRHPNIVEMVDVMEPGDEEGDCTDGNLCMAMPLFRMGDLKRAIKKGIILHGAAGRTQRVHIAHGLLSAVAFLHDNHIIHRDIKADNVMITLADEENGHDDAIKPVLIDFSLAKFVDGPNTVLPPGSTHTGEVGTPTYTAPEVVAKENYGLKSDMWSVGVVLLETLIGELATEKDKAAARIIEEKKATLPESPFVNLIRGLLEHDVEKRLSAREALASPVFEKFNLEPPPVRIIDIDTAIPDDDQDDKNDGENQNNSNIVKKTNNFKQQKKLSPRERLVKKLCAEIETRNPKTEYAALFYAKKMEYLDEELENISETQTLLDCIIIANQFYEEALIDLESVAEDFPSFGDFDIDSFRDNELALCSLLDYCLYLRS